MDWMGRGNKEHFLSQPRRNLDKNEMTDDKQTDTISHG